MPICVISTTGTSVFSNAQSDLKKEAEYFRKRSDIDLSAICKRDQFDGHDLYLRTLEYLRAEAKAPQASDVIPQASAELRSLTHILSEKRTRSDQLHFLATATPDGALAARIIADFSRQYFDAENVSVHLISGLQVNDGEVFQRDGVRNLIAKTYDILSAAHPGVFQRVINPTGGFKGVVPYLTLIGMIEPEVKLSYIYEQSKALISLGRIPLQLDFAVLEAAYPALLRCSEDFVTEEELSSLLRLGAGGSLTEHPAWSLFDQEQQDDSLYFSINGLGAIVMEHFKTAKRTKIYLSRQAAERYDAFDANRQQNFAKYFERLRDSAWLDAHRHDEVAQTGEAVPIKPGNVDERLFVYPLAESGLLIAELALHRTDGSYDRIPHRRKDYDTHRLWEGKA